MGKHGPSTQKARTEHASRTSHVGGCDKSGSGGFVRVHGTNAIISRDEPPVPPCVLLSLPAAHRTLTHAWVFPASLASNLSGGLEAPSAWDWHGLRRRTGWVGHDGNEWLLRGGTNEMSDEQVASRCRPSVRDSPACAQHEAKRGWILRLLSFLCVALFIPMRPLQNSKGFPCFHNVSVRAFDNGQDKGVNAQTMAESARAPIKLPFGFGQRNMGLGVPMENSMTRYRRTENACDPGLGCIRDGARKTQARTRRDAS